jgi:uncharacterized hydrophobic protein (TIGR00271 family)
VGAEDAARVRDTVVFERPGLQVKLVRFWILLILAAAISTYGLLADSVATVIGAMIVAPLMLPIMGLAYSVSIGDGRAILGSIAVGISGSVLAVGVGYVLALIMPAGFDPEQVDQIMIRTAPRLIDLLAALATGLAGSFAISRSDVSDTLPGVAIAISLVPPLANVGILLSADRADLAYGSLLLFVTNYLAILLTGALVFGLMGYPRVAFVGRSRRNKQVAIAVAFTMLLLICVPLGLRSLVAYAQHTAEATAAKETQQWLEGSGYEFVSATWNADREAVVIIVAGSGPLPPQAALQGALDGRLYGRDVALEAVATERLEFQTQPATE